SQLQHDALDQGCPFDDEQGLAGFPADHLNDGWMIPTVESGCRAEVHVTDGAQRYRYSDEGVQRLSISPRSRADRRRDSKCADPSK
ncbi:hypothetical protein ACIWKD_32630, partial [Pseudomonas aeruginosa]|uniref:hypothetical protein n=1 Tax=Pseudomonas aeruginosa TaxID=287 RepID=UPI00384D8D60